MKLLLQTVTSTPPPSRPAAVSPTTGAPFVLPEKRLVRDVDQLELPIGVEVWDATEKPAPSAEVGISWVRAMDYFLTGHSQRAKDSSAAEWVEEEGGKYWGSWHLVFKQP